MSFLKYYLLILSVFFVSCTADKSTNKQVGKNRKPQTVAKKNKPNNKKALSKKKKPAAGNKNYWKRLQTDIGITDKQVAELKKIKQDFIVDRNTKKKASKDGKLDSKINQQLIQEKNKKMKKVLGDKLYNAKRKFDKQNRKK